MIPLKYPGIILFIWTCLAVSAPARDGSDGLDFTAGLGYDFLSQEFFLDSAILSGPDSAQTSWSLNSNYLDDIKGMFSLRYSPYDDRRLEITTKYEQTPEVIRIKAYGDSRHRVRASRLDLSAEMDWRTRYNGESTIGDNYLFIYLRSKLTSPLGKSLNALAELRGESVTFDSASSYTFDYYRLGGKLGLEKRFGDFSFGDIKLTVMGRQVPDSSDNSYLTVGLESFFFSIYSKGEIDLYTRVESKNYRLQQGYNDHYRAEVFGRHKIRLSPSWFIGQQIDFDLVEYNADDPLNNSYFMVEVVLLSGFESSEISIAAGPNLEFLRQKKDEFLSAEDYFEAGLELNFDYLRLGKFFLSSESVTGYRDISQPTDLYTDYWFQRLNIIGDLRIWKNLGLNTLYSVEWEWHDTRTNNSTIHLLSTRLAYDF